MSLLATTAAVAASQGIEETGSDNQCFRHGSRAWASAAAVDSSGVNAVATQ
jgi:hypothetical protein